MRARIDRGRCLGYGECSIVAPHMFIVGEEDNQSHVLDDDEAWKDTESAKLAESICPMQAIILTEG